MSDINIFLLDNVPGNEGRLERILSQNSFNVFLIHSLEKSVKTIIENLPDIILIRDPENSIKYSDILKWKTDAELDNDLPVVVFSPFENPDMLFDKLSSEIFCHINSPCTVEFLISKIKNILSYTKEVKSNEVHTLKLDHGSENTEIELKKQHVNNFISSLVDNSLHQNKLLKMIINNDCKFEPVEGVSELLIDKFECSDKHPEYQENLVVAFEKDEFELFYQPVYSLIDDNLYGFETLIRWRHPENGIITPDEFIPVIEESTLMVPLGYWIIDEASKQLKKWQNKYQFSDFPRININLSPKQFSQRDLSSRINDILVKNDVNPACIGIEITESVFMKDVESVNLILLELKSKEVSLYLDDFGTGYSSLSYLLHFPFDTLKIDKSFVQWMHIDEQSGEIVRSVVALAHNLKKKVVAEGVESEEHYNTLKVIGCDYGQGYYFSKPLCSEDAEKLLNEYCN